MDNTVFISTTKQLLSQGIPIEINAEGYSMYPFLLPGDKLTITPTLWESLKKGDIIIWQKDNTLIAHRIIKKHRDYCIPAGDARITNDGKILPEDILGKATVFRRGNRQKPFNSFTSKLFGIIVTYANPITRQLFTRMANWHRRKLNA